MVVEEWRDIFDFPDYEVSNFGYIRSKKTLRILKAGKIRTGYHQVTLRKNNRSYQVYIHQEVAKAFLGDLSSSLEVDHLDSEVSNNRADNLEWVTRAENNRRTVRRGRHAGYCGPIKKVIIIETGEVFSSASELAEHLGTHRSSISNVLHGRSKTIFGYHVEYLNPKHFGKISRQDHRI